MAEGSPSANDSLLADAISKMDALRSRMDELEVGEKNIIKGDGMTRPKNVIKDDEKTKSDDDDDDDKKKSDDDDDDRKDSAKKSDDDDDRKDSAKKSDDDDDKKKDDAFPPPKKGKRGDDGELEIKHKKEDSKGKRSDDDDDKKSDDDDDKKKSDDDDDDRKDSAAKADSVGVLRRQLADQAETIRRLEAMMKPRSDDEHYAFAEAQAKADSVFSSFGQRAPRPMEGEHLEDYRCRLATKLKGHSKAWSNVKLSKLPAEAFQIAEGQIYADAATAAANPIDLAAGELREVQKVDPATGLRTIVFYGKESFVKSMGRPGRRVQSFRTLASQ